MNGIIKIFFIFLGLVCLLSCKDGSKTRPTELSEVDRLTEKIASSPRKAELYMMRSKAYRALEGYDEAIADIKRAILIDSTKAEYFYQLSDTYFDYLDSFQARSILEQASLRFPDSLDAHLKLSRLLIIIKDYDDASLALQRAKAVDPYEAEVEYTRGIFFLDQGRTEAAANAFKAAVELDDELIDGWISLGRIAAESGDEKAITYFENALRIEPNNIRALHSTAFFLHNSDSLTKATSLYKKINRIDSTYVHAYFNQGIIYLEQRDWPQAKTMFETSLALDSTMVLAAYYAGLTFDSLGDRASAKAAYQRAVKIDPSFTRAINALGAQQNSIPNQ